jgi:uncharacterized protein (TIGR03086 family)
MNATSAQYAEADRRLTDVLAAVPAERWSSPSPCDEWSARDVVWHLIETQRDLLTARDIDLGEPPDKDGDPAAAWREHGGRVGTVLSDDTVPATEFDGYFGPTTVGATLEQFYIWDMLVHRWDIARAAGVEAGLSDVELDRIDQGADSFGDGLYMEGICRPGVEAPPDATRAARVLARLGRNA